MLLIFLEIRQLKSKNPQNQKEDRAENFRMVDIRINA